MRVLHRYVIRTIRPFSEQFNWKIPQSDLFCICLLFLSLVHSASGWPMVLCCSELFEVSVSFHPLRLSNPHVSDDNSVRIPATSWRESHHLMISICIPSFNFLCSKLGLDRSPAYPAVLLFRFRRFILQRQHFISYLIYIQVSHADIDYFRRTWS